MYLPSGEESSIPSDEYSGNTYVEMSDTEVDDAWRNVLLGIDTKAQPGPSSFHDHS